MPNPAISGALALTLCAGMAHGDVSPDRAEELKHILLQDCGSCHGLTLKGGLGTPLTAQALQGADADVLRGVILDGVPGTAMPPWRPLLSEQEADWITRYLLKQEIAE